MNLLFYNIIKAINASVDLKFYYCRRGALGFSVLRFWLFFRSVFRFLLQKTSVFRFWWSLRFADFSFFSIWFSVFVKNTSGFSVLVPDVVFHIIFSLVQGRDMEGQ